MQKQQDKRMQQFEERTASDVKQLAKSVQSHVVTIADTVQHTHQQTQNRLNELQRNLVQNEHEMQKFRQKSLQSHISQPEASSSGFRQAADDEQQMLHGQERRSTSGAYSGRELQPGELSRLPVKSKASISTKLATEVYSCLLYTSPSPRDRG